MDYVEAYKWLYVIGPSNSPEIESTIAALAEKMTPEQIARALQQAREWQPKNEMDSVPGAKQFNQGASSSVAR